MRRVLTALATGLSLVALACDGEERVTEPRALPEQPGHSFIGIVAEDVLAGDAGYRARTLGRLRDAGVGLIRQTFHWDRIERAPGRYDFAEYDAYVEVVARHGFELLPILFTPPPFRSGAPDSGAARGTYPPRRYADLGAFAGELIQRYGPGGSFWRERPELPPRPIRAWQVWNEPNLPQYWPEGPDPAAYAELLRTTADAIRRADPGAEVVSAGLSESRLGIPFEDFVRGLYEAAGEETIDLFALHAFGRSPEATLAAAESTRKLLEELDADPPIWVTEFGWASGGPPSPFTVGPQAQAERIGDVLRGFARRREDLGLRGVVYFNWRDAPPYEGGEDFFGLHTGLLDIRGRPKPALEAFSGAAKAVGR